MSVAFHVIGDAYVDLFCFLDGDWPERGGDSRMAHPLRVQAGGSSINTSTHLQLLIKNFPRRRNVPSEEDKHTDSVTLHTVFNPHDDYGQLLAKHVTTREICIMNSRAEEDTSSTGHCVVVVSKGERSFMTHQGCVERFAVSSIQTDRIVNTDSSVHVHVSGFFNTVGFWHGKLSQMLEMIRRERKRLYPTYSTTFSLVTQHDASNGWDGGLDEIIPHLDFLILNELEATRIMERRCTRLSTGLIQTDPVASWNIFFSRLNSSTCFVVTRGEQGAVAFRNGKVIATVFPSVSIEVVDPTGAGDAFTAGFLYGIWSSLREKVSAQESTPCTKAAIGIITTPSWTDSNVEDGVYWGCAAGTASVTVRGASEVLPITTIQRIFENQKEHALPGNLQIVRE